MDQNLIEGVVELQIRPFAVQKALFFFIGIVFYSFMFEPGLARANNDLPPAEQKHALNEIAVIADDPKIGELKLDVGSCALESIQHKQRHYKKQVFLENFHPFGTSDSRARPAGLKSRQIEEIGFKVIATTPHDIGAYTEGLVYHQNYLYESTGGLGASDIRKVDLVTGRVISVKQLPDNLFAEGLALVDNRLIQITLKKNLALIYDIENFKVLDKFKFSGDGWGIVAIDNSLLISDGSSMLRRINVKDHQLLTEDRVTANGVELEGINEMENVNGMIYANIWPTDCIAIIDPEKHKVVAWINLTGLYPEDKRLNPSSVLNGIAYESSQNKLFVTGKYWPHIYHLKLDRYPGRLLKDKD